MGRRVTGVATFDELSKIERIGVPYLVHALMISKADIVKENLLAAKQIEQFVVINRTIEGLLYPYLKDDANYQDNIADIKACFSPDRLVIPMMQYKAWAALGRWDNLLATTMQRAGWYPQKEEAGRI